MFDLRECDNTVLLDTDHRQPRHQPFSHALVMGRSRTYTAICLKLFEDQE